MSPGHTDDTDNCRVVADVLSRIGDKWTVYVVRCADDTLYCSAKSGFIPGVHGGVYASSVEGQLRQTMRNLLDGLEEAGMNFSNVVSSNVYLDNIDDFARMNGVYAEYFDSTPPARTTVQQILPGPRSEDAKGHWPTLEQISIIAVK